MSNQVESVLGRLEALKREQGGAVLLFRLGDFYESFGGDAAVVSEVCHVGRCSRPRVGWLAGIPYHRLDESVRRLQEAGYRVAVCEQETNEDGERVERWKSY
jgi:DNA mismatch repair protein MutS